MQKDFQAWHKEKSLIQADKSRPFFHEREIWFSTLGANIGFEEDGKGDEFLRPILVFKKFSKEVFWGIPTTQKIKSGKYYHEIHLEGKGKNNLILSQLRIFDAKRLQYKIGSLSEQNFEEVKQKIRQLIA